MQIPDQLQPGLTAELDFTVSQASTAVVVGSGSLPVLATPTVLAWMEATCCAAIDQFLSPPLTSVGVAVNLQHLAATKPGEIVRVRAELIEVTGKVLRFQATAATETTQLATAELGRVLVAGDQFMARL